MKIYQRGLDVIVSIHDWIKNGEIKQVQEKDYKSRMGLCTAMKINSLALVSRLVALQIMPECVAQDSTQFL